MRWSQVLLVNDFMRRSDVLPIQLRWREDGRLWEWHSLRKAVVQSLRQTRPRACRLTPPIRSNVRQISRRVIALHLSCQVWPSLKSFGANIPDIGPSETLVAPLHRHPVAEAGGAGHGAGAHPHVHQAGAFAGYGGEGAEAALLPR